MSRHNEKASEREQHRARQSEQMTAAPLLANEFPQLRSLTMELGQYDEQGATRISQMKLTLNLKHTSSIVRIHCGNMDCVRGDFDLSRDITEAVASRRTSATGELRCQGWRTEATIDRIRCGRILRYKLALEYA